MNRSKAKKAKAVKPVQVVYDEEARQVVLMVGDKGARQVALTGDDGRTLLFDWHHSTEGGVLCSYYPANTLGSIDMPYMQNGYDNYSYHSSTVAEVVKAYNDAVKWREAELAAIL